MGWWPWGTNRVLILQEMMKTSFARVRGDISLLSSWVKYLKERDDLHNTRHERMSYFVGKMSAEIDDLKAEVARLQNQMSSGQVRTYERTDKGQVEDMSRDQHQRQTLPSRAKPVAALPGPAGLRGSQLEVLHLLYDSDRPLGYDEIARRLEKSEKSIRNLIYELRVAGIKVKDKPIGLREKGFFLDSETKIGVSGR